MKDSPLTKAWRRLAAVRNQNEIHQPTYSTSPTLSRKYPRRGPFLNPSRAEAALARERYSYTDADRSLGLCPVGGRGDFLAEDAHIVRRFDPQPDLVAIDLHHRHNDSTVDDDLFVQLAA